MWGGRDGAAMVVAMAGRGEAVLGALLRAFPAGLAVALANRLHYGTLRAATALARAPRKDGGGGRLTSSFELTRSLPMRRVRYWIKLMRYSATLGFLALACPFLPELKGLAALTVPSLTTVLAAFLAAMATIILRENANGKMRTLWRPAVDFNSAVLGVAFDTLRFVGDVTAVPIEEELLFRSLLYRSVVAWRSSKYRFFLDVPFSTWSWEGAIATNLLYGWLHGGECVSAALSGLFFQLVAVEQGSFLSAVAVHAIMKALIGLWVMFTSQRDYW